MPATMHSAWSPSTHRLDLSVQLDVCKPTVTLRAHTDSDMKLWRPGLLAGATVLVAEICSSPRVKKIADEIEAGGDSYSRNLRGSLVLAVLAYSSPLR